MCLATCVALRSRDGSPWICWIFRIIGLGCLNPGFKSFERTPVYWCSVYISSHDYMTRHQKVNTLCHVDVRHMSYSHWLSVTSLAHQRCYFGHETLLLCLATFGLLLNCLTISTQLQQQMIMLCDWLWRHLIAKIQWTELRPDHRSIVACVISRVCGKKPDSLSLPRCQSQPNLHLEDCYKTYHMTRSSAATDRPCDMLCQSESCQLLYNCRNRLYIKSK